MKGEPSEKTLKKNITLNITVQKEKKRLQVISVCKGGISSTF